MNEKHLQNWLNIRKERRKTLSSKTLFLGISSGNIGSLSEGITLLESSVASQKKIANELLNLCLPNSGKSIRIGITGVPGVGKSSFIEVFGLYLVSLGKKIAVLAIDPSSEKTGGSILGDKTRMHDLSVNEHVFIRPTSAGKTLGGVARATRESIILCEAAGYDVILIETVGVGQSEIAVHSMVDYFLLLMLAGAGDELQGIKRGIMEMADGIAITKTDGENVKKANLARQEYANAIHLFPPNKSQHTTPVRTVSSVSKNGIDSIWKEILSYQNLTTINGYFDEKRKKQAKYWLHETVKEQLLDRFYSKEQTKKELAELEQAVLNGLISPFEAAEKLLSQNQ